MEKILATMDPANTHFNAGIHALALAKRIKAKVLFLLVYPPTPKPSARPRDPAEALAEKRLAALIEEARTDGIAVDYYVARGPFEKELVSFVLENKITLLVVESPSRGGSPNGLRDFLDKIRHRIDCHIEVVNEKPESPERKE